MKDNNSWNILYVFCLALLSDHWKLTTFFSLSWPENPILLINPILHFAILFYQTFKVLKCCEVFLQQWVTGKKGENKYSQMSSSIKIPSIVRIFNPSGKLILLSNKCKYSESCNHSSEKDLKITSTLHFLFLLKHFICYTSTVCSPWEQQNLLALK